MDKKGLEYVFGSYVYVLGGVLIGYGFGIGNAVLAIGGALLVIFGPLVVNYIVWRWY